MEELKFRTKTGYCHILPDKILLTREGVIGQVANVVTGNKSIAKILIIHSISILIWLCLAFFSFSAAVINFSQGKFEAAFILFVSMCFLLFLLIFGIVGVLRSFNNSTTPVIIRDKIEKVTFHKAIPYITRAYFTVYFTDENGKKKKRLIMLPGSMTGGSEETQEALEVMKQGKII